MRQPQYSRSARRDLDGIWDYIAADDPAAAERMLRRIDAQCQQLAASPDLGERWPEFSRTFAC
jgi:plasmid stabilization system protein ParE